jgi:hypothetical protein
MDDSIADNLKVLNAAEAISRLEDESLFNMMIDMLFDNSLIPELGKLKIAMETFDFKTIRISSHTIKAPSAYVGGERAKRAAEIVQFNVDKQQGPKIYQNYPKIIQETIKLRREIRKYKVEKKLEGAPPEFKECDEDFVVPICSFYKLEKISSTDFRVIQVTFPTIPPVPFLDISAKRTSTNLPVQKPTEINQPKPEIKKVEESPPKAHINNTAVKNHVAEVKKPDPPAPSPQNKDIAVEIKDNNIRSQPSSQQVEETKKKEETTACACLLL